MNIPEGKCNQNLPIDQHGRCWLGTQKISEIGNIQIYWNVLLVLV